MKACIDCGKEFEPTTARNTLCRECQDLRYRPKVHIDLHKVGVVDGLRMALELIPDTQPVLEGYVYGEPTQLAIIRLAIQDKIKEVEE